MAKRLNPEDNPEGFVKNYQLEITNSKLDTLIDGVNTVQKQVGDYQSLILSRPTTVEVKAMIDAAKLESEKNLKDFGEKQDLKYSPIVSGNKWLLGLLLASGIGLFGTLIFIAIGLTK